MRTSKELVKKLILLGMLVEIEDKIVSGELFTKHFVCDLSKCKGACCVEGDDGAPLTPEEVSNINQHLDDIKPFMSERGRKTVEERGVSYNDIEGLPVTTLVPVSNECAFVTVNEQGIALCAIELAHKNNAIPNIKPISCSLYPIRTKQFNEYTALQIHDWNICSPACDCGNNLQIPVYKFLKEPIIRAFGEPFYEELVKIEPEIKSL